MAVLGITFSEIMSGAFALGQNDPFAGQLAGRAAGTAMVMNATITISDLDTFIADPLHQGIIKGRIDFSPLGLQLPSPRGVFNLFSPTSNPDAKSMIYEMGFEAGGVSYYLAGHKDVVKSSVFELWHATTTLYAQLHTGSDTSGPVIGAGILALSMHDLMEMVHTMRAVNSASARETAEALMKFGKFFFGELWEAYIAKEEPDHGF